MQNRVFVKIAATNEWPNHSLLNPYIAFCIFKTFNSQGRITRKDLNAHGKDRYYYNRWIRVVCSLGWATEIRGVYFLKTYQEVWRKLGIKECNYEYDNKRVNKFRYIRISLDQLPAERKEVVKKIKDLIQRSICNRHCTQRKHRLLQGKTKRFKRRQPVPLSAEGVQNLLGYKSISAGHKARKRYFTLSKKKSILRIVPTNRGGVIFRNDSKEVLV